MIESIYSYFAVVLGYLRIVADNLPLIHSPTDRRDSNTTLRPLDCTTAGKIRLISFRFLGIVRILTLFSF